MKQILFKHDFSSHTAPTLKDNQNKEKMQFKYAIPWVRVHNVSEKQIKGKGLWESWQYTVECIRSL
jgi:hypothetical protein